MFQVLLPPRAAHDARRVHAGDEATRGIGIGVHYPAMHLFRCTGASGWQRGEFPHAERIGARIVTLPLFPAMTDADVDRVVPAPCAVHRARSMQAHECSR